MILWTIVLRDVLTKFLSIHYVVEISTRKQVIWYERSILVSAHICSSMGPFIGKKCSIISPLQQSSESRRDSSSISYSCLACGDISIIANGWINLRNQQGTTKREWIKVDATEAPPIPSISLPPSFVSRSINLAYLKLSLTPLLNVNMLMIWVTFVRSMWEGFT